MLRGISSAVFGSDVEQFGACVHALKMGFAGGNISMMAAGLAVWLAICALSNEKTLNNRAFTGGFTAVVAGLLPVGLLVRSGGWVVFEQGRGGSPARPAAMLYMHSVVQKFSPLRIHRELGRGARFVRRLTPICSVPENASIPNFAKKGGAA